MVWHDCKTDPPKETGVYIGYYNITSTWEQAYYYAGVKEWCDFIGDTVHPYKWAEVDLSEVE